MKPHSTAMRLLTLALPLTAVLARAAEPPADPQAAAQAFADHLVAGRFDAAAAMFDERVRAKLDADKLKETWNKLAEQCGAFQSLGAPRRQSIKDATSIFFPAKWKNASLDMQVIVDGSGHVSGLWFKPAQTTDAYETPKYVKKSGFSERDVKVGSNPWLLDGKLTVPRDASKKLPGVVLVHGSGPNDMDETIGPNRPFRDLAWGLASHGIVVLRYNKRTNTYGGAMKAEDVNVRAEVIDDALSALKLLRSQPEVDPQRTYVIGHSLGGCLAPSIAREDAELAGFVSLSGTLRPMEQVILDQFAHLASIPGEGQAAARKSLADARKAVAEFKAGKNGADWNLLGAPARYWQDLGSYLGASGQKAAREFNRPILILGGGRDYQITRTDFELWRTTLKDRPNATLRWLPDVNHLYAPGQGMSTPEEYMGKQQHVAKEVVEGIAAWIRSGQYPAAAVDPLAKPD